MTASISDLDTSFSVKEKNSRKKTSTVLVVDDKPSERILLEQAISKWGYSVLTASSGKDAIELYKKHRPALVLMDVMMPGMDGKETARQLQKIASNDFLVIIFVTELDDIGIKASIDSTGCDFINKSSNRAMLEMKLDTYEQLKCLHEKSSAEHEELSQLREAALQEQEVAMRLISGIQKQGTKALSDMRHLNYSADILCGDLLLAGRRPSGGLNVLIGDLTGHGLAAAVGALPVAQIFNAMTSKGFSSEKIVREINSKLIEVLTPNMFCAATLIYFSDDATHAEIWQGGMPEILIVDKEQSKIVGQVGSKHIPMGVLSTEEFDSQMEIIELTPSHNLYIFSDGLPEAENSNGEFYGDERLHNLLEAGPASLAFDRVSDDLNKFCRNTVIRDDISLLEVPCNPEYLLSQCKDQHSEEIPNGQPWSWELKLAAESLASLDPVPSVLRHIVDLQGMEPYSDVLFIILSELYNNALDHGILKLKSEIKNETDGFERYYEEREKRLSELDSGSISILTANEPMDAGGMLTITVRDSGDGFDTEKILANLNKTDENPSGRGLAMVYDLCNTVEIQEKGNCIKTTLIWHCNPQDRIQKAT